MADINTFFRILRNSHRYELRTDGILRVTDYYTGEEIALDLNQMSEEVFEEMQVEEQEDDEYDY